MAAPKSTRTPDARSSNGTPLFWKACPQCGARSLVDKRRLDKPCHPCAMKARSTHGMSEDPLYRRWTGMVARCRYPSTTNFAYYGGRGIKVCPEWDQSFEAFRDWAQANGWDPALEIDRIDPDGDYTPENCRFIPHDMNSRIRRNARATQEQADEVKRMLAEGLSVKAAAREAGVPYMTAWHIKNSGTWS